MDPIDSPAHSTPGASASPPSSPPASPTCLASTLRVAAEAGVSLYVIRGLFEHLGAVLSMGDRSVLAGWGLALAVAVSPASVFPVIGRVATAAVRARGGGDR